jgi:hypothetical protein
MAVKQCIFKGDGTRMDKITVVSESGRSSAQNEPATPEMALIKSFNRLVLSGRYEDISVKSIAGQADVSRSTCSRQRSRRIFANSF